MIPPRTNRAILFRMGRPSSWEIGGSPSLSGRFQIAKTKAPQNRRGMMHGSLTGTVQLANFGEPGRTEAEWRRWRHRKHRPLRWL